MKVRCSLVRKDGTEVTIGKTVYHFKPEVPGGDHFCDVTNKKHLAKFLAIPEAYDLGEDEVVDEQDEDETEIENENETDTGGEGDSGTNENESQGTNDTDEIKLLRESLESMDVDGLIEKYGKDSTHGLKLNRNMLQTTMIEKIIETLTDGDDS